MSNTVSTNGLNSLWGNESGEYLQILNQEKLILKVTEEVWSLLEADKLSKADLAEKMGVTRAYVTQLLNGSRNMTLRTLADIAYVLDKKVNVIFQDTKLKTASSGNFSTRNHNTFSNTFLTGGEHINIALFVTNNPGDHLNAEKASTQT